MFTFLSFYSNIIVFKYFLSCCGVLSIIVGSVGAFYQEKIKRLLAFSAITNIGFIFLSISTMTTFGFFAAFLHLFIYILLVTNAFLLLILIERWPGGSINHLVEFISISRLNFIYSLLLILLFFSLAGIPPFIGFFGKAFIVLALIDDYSYGLAAFIILASIVSSVYYVRLVRFLFFVDQDKYPIYFERKRKSEFFIL